MPPVVCTLKYPAIKPTFTLFPGVRASQILWKRVSLVSIKVLSLRRAWLVLGWVTEVEFAPSWYSINYPSLTRHGLWRSVSDGQNAWLRFAGE